MFASSKLRTSWRLAAVVRRIAVRADIYDVILREITLLRDDNPIPASTCRLGPMAAG